MRSASDHNVEHFFNSGTSLLTCMCMCFLVQTREVMMTFGRLYEQQYAVALFNKVRFDIEGEGGPQPQLLHRKVKYSPTSTLQD